MLKCLEKVIGFDIDFDVDFHQNLSNFEIENRHKIDRKDDQKSDVVLDWILG